MIHFTESELACQSLAKRLALRRSRQQPRKRKLRFYSKSLLSVLAETERRQHENGIDKEVESVSLRCTQGGLPSLGKKR